MPFVPSQSTLPPHTTNAGRMRRRRFLSRVAMAALLAAPIAAAAAGDPAAAALAGSWTLKAAYDLHPDGRKTFGFGARPTGVLMIDAQGRYSLQIFRGDEPTFTTDAQGSRKEFKPAEIASTHYGRVDLDPAAHTVTFRIDRAYFQRWNNTVQVRPYVLSGNELSYQVPAQPGSDSVAVSVWQRAESPAPAQESPPRESREPVAALRLRGTDVVGP